MHIFGFTLNLRVKCRFFYLNGVFRVGFDIWSKPNEYLYIVLIYYPCYQDWNIANMIEDQNKIHFPRDLHIEVI